MLSDEEVLGPTSPFDGRPVIAPGWSCLNIECRVGFEEPNVFEDYCVRSVRNTVCQDGSFMYLSMIHYNFIVFYIVPLWNFVLLTVMTSTGSF